MPEDLRSEGEPTDRPVMLGDVFGRLGWLPAVRLNALWSAAAGGAIASNARVTGRRDASVILECSSSEWIAQLAEMEGELIQRLHRLGLQWIEKLEFELARAGPKNRSSTRSRVLGTKRAQQIHASVEEVTSPPVRDALERVLRAYALFGIDDGKAKEKS